ncbi:hypothetical protein AB833_23975 [Chromatiales bacterium (ex Bugula neritina AB1)]|nr:hypothetical protein AB833_23975 [Chromatiales bacterium (ex Bugula neritina AB1)]
MFQALAGYAVRGSLQAALVASSTLLLSLVLPPLVVVSSAIVALAWLRLGARAGGIAVLIAVVASTFIAIASGLQPLAPTAVMLSSWLPVIVMAVVLRATISLDLAILAGAALVVIGLLCVYLVVPDPAANWREFFSVVMENANLRPRALEGSDPEQVRALLEKASVMMTGFYAATLFLIAALSLLLARAWQARLFNPGGLRREFHDLRFGRGASIAGLVVVIAAQLVQAELLYSLAMVVVAVFAFQGMAIAHSLVGSRGMARGWLIGVYVLLVFLSPESLLIVGLAGLTDAWLDFRNRFGNNVPGDGQI